MDHPEKDGDKDYSVRLLFNVRANNPAHAVGRYWDRIATHGNKDWVYRVMDRATGEEFMVHPAESAVYTLEEFEERLAGATTPEQRAARLAGVEDDDSGV